ncbi:MAG: Homoserine/Threonine efflux protein [Candidatus Tokpelaia hoelldobleri]|uniref:Homoserine/Threonine efflux protein n=1 Tax=Candidatus Tokpelaia hoelldobleri TaxID=1902579 RepID=A0A1U9JWY6_9HYPH|nr:MAG: Homoserine/Threonine efflux protein [Candidatus Tokpelaia hoelldoblerii]
MQPYVLEFSGLFIAFALVLVAPGADFAIVVRQALVHGRRSAMITTLGISTAFMIHVSYTVLGLGLIISQSLLLFNLVKWAGVAYLVYIGVRALMSRGTDVAVAAEMKEKITQSARKAFALGFTVNALNPKAVFFFLAIFSAFVAPATPSAVKFGYGLAMAVVVIIWFSCVGIFLTTPVVQRFFSRISRWLDRICGVVFIGFGIRLMFQEAS